MRPRRRRVKDEADEDGRDIRIRTASAVANGVMRSERVRAASCYASEERLNDSSTCRRRAVVNVSSEVPPSGEMLALCARRCAMASPAGRRREVCANRSRPWSTRRRAAEPASSPRAAIRSVEPRPSTEGGHPPLEPIEVSARKIVVSRLADPRWTTLRPWAARRRRDPGVRRAPTACASKPRRRVRRGYVRRRSSASAALLAAPSNLCPAATPPDAPQQPPPHGLRNLRKLTADGGARRLAASAAPAAVPSEGHVDTSSFSLRRAV